MDAGHRPSDRRAGGPVTAALRVVVADDHFLVREGLRTLLEAVGDVDVVGTAADATALLAATEATCPDAVLTDIKMPPGNGLDGIHAALEIRERWPAVGVVVLSQHLEGAYAAELFSRGSAGLGYLLKERVGEREELVDALRATAGGGSVLDARVVDALVATRSRSAGSPVGRLTTREREVLALMAQGRSNQGIADRMHLSLSSIEKHVNSIFTALDLTVEAATHRRVAAVVAYLQTSQVQAGHG